MSDYQPTPPPSTPYTGSSAAPPKTNVLSILSLIFGILGVVTSLLLVGSGILPGIAGVVLGFIARRREPSAKGMWLTGIITGFVAIAIAIVIWIGLAIVYAIALNNGFSN